MFGVNLIKSVHLKRKKQEFNFHSLKMFQVVVLENIVAHDINISFIS